ncbi:hypothetical protein GEV33_006700 [Tenebrio molitor]|uniref:TTF-type domain-containing protein n=1 Tax=Tenebrio molitor TaxID=7067 RepID=A0A8J6HJI7_TENMO|nr:hypothetical protein GEV33_006700 [Tenebrio molitor]
MGKLIKQVELKTYPKQANGRSFHSDWYKKFKWLEYSVQSDAAFCYACRQFQPFANKEKTYTETGYRNWKNALDSKNGFPKHENTEVHITSMKMWKEKLARQNTGISVSTLVNHNILEKHRYYIKSIAEIIQFLAINELALRGAYEAEEHAERSLFSNLFKFTLKKDTLLSECAQHIPKNANYTSPAIQNEIIEILSDIVRESVVADIRNADVPWFTLMEDGTRDKNNRENISIAIRYVKNGKVFESLLGIYTTKELDAKNFTDLTLDIMEKNNLDTSRLLSQCYDGASVMSGKRGGVAALIQKKLKRNVPPSMKIACPFCNQRLATALNSHTDGKIRDGYGEDGCGRKVCRAIGQALDRRLWLVGQSRSSICDLPFAGSDWSAGCSRESTNLVPVLEPSVAEVSERYQYIYA